MQNRASPESIGALHKILIRCAAYILVSCGNRDGLTAGNKLVEDGGQAVRHEFGDPYSTRTSLRCVSKGACIGFHFFWPEVFRKPALQLKKYFVTGVEYDGPWHPA